MDNLYIILSVIALIPSAVQFFSEKRKSLRILWAIVFISVIGLDAIGYLGSMALQGQSANFQNQLGVTRIQLSQTQNQLFASEASTTKLQKEIANISPSRDTRALYDPSENIVAEIPTEENIPTTISQDSTVLFPVLCDVTEISPGEIVTIYPYGQAIQMQLAGSSTVMSSASFSMGGEVSCANLVNQVAFRLVKK